jgi:uncharacterized coiled-coil protein SlyX
MNPTDPHASDQEAIAAILNSIEERMVRLEIDAAAGKDVSDILKEIADLRAQLGVLSNRLKEMEGPQGPSR